MEAWIELYTPARASALRRKRIVFTLLFWAVALGGLLFCVLSCLHAGAEAGRVLFVRMLLAAVPCGWVCIALRLELLSPLRRMAEHAEHMRAGPRETLRGNVTVTDELMRIRRSIAVRTVLLRDGETTRRLNVCAPYARLLGGATREMTLAVVGSYITAFTPAPPDGPAKRGGGQAALRMLRRILSTLHNYVLWLLIAVFLCGFACTRVTDTAPANKVTVMIDAPAADEAALAAALDAVKPDGIRMVKVHTFSYAFMETSSLQSADVFIVRASNAAQYLPGFQPLPQGFEGTYYSADGTVWGLLVYDADAQRGCADTYIQYAAPGAIAEDYYLFFGKESLHTGAQDDAACVIARALMELN